MGKYDGLLLKRVDAFFKEFESYNGEILYIIEPGYVINKYAYLIWRMMDEEIQFENLSELLVHRIKGATEDYCKSLLAKTIDQLYHRQLLLINGKPVDQKQYFSSTYLSEDDFLNTFQVRPITQIDLVVTTKCNFQCKHCYIKKENLRDSGCIPVDAWKETLNRLSKIGLLSITVTGGEPLTYFGLVDVLDYANDLGMKIQLLTNGFLIDEAFAKRIAAYRNIIVQVSLDGSSADSSEKQRGFAGAFNRTIHNIELLTSLGIEVIVAMVLNKENIHDLFDGSMVRLCSNLGVHVLGITPTVISVSNAAENSEMFLSPQEAYDAVCYVNRENDNNTFPENLIVNIGVPPALSRENSISRVKKIRPRCRRGTNSFSVRPNGDVYVCTDFAELNYAEYHIGNILFDDISDIIAKLTPIERKKKTDLHKIKGVCSICKELPCCWGACRADAFSKYHDMNAPYPFCQSLYELGIFPSDEIETQLTYREID